MNKKSREYSFLVSLVKAVLDKHDLMGLRALGAPLDEYEPQARAIASSVKGCTSVEMCLKIIRRVFDDSFGDSPGDETLYRDVANEIFEVTAQYRLDAI